MRAHGPAPATLRRALAQLVEAGIVIRRDSPNGKRYARRGEGGQVEQAFGFDLSPLVARAAEFERLADAVRAEARARSSCARRSPAPARHRQDDRDRASRRSCSGHGRLSASAYAGLGACRRARPTARSSEAIAIELRALRLDVDKCLSENLKSEDSNVNEFSE